MTKQIKLFTAAFIAALFSACSDEKLDILVSVPDESSNAIYSESEIKQYSSPEELLAAFENYKEDTKTRSDVHFISYLETVMSKPGYEDLPYAILSSAFGSILNQDGELVFGDNLIHVSKYGLLYGPYEEKMVIRDLAENEKLPSLCNSRGYYAPLSNSNFFIVDGYDNIYLYDTFGIVEKNNGGNLLTRSGYDALSGNVNSINITSQSDEVGFRWQENGLWRYNWGAEFTIPGAGDQKQIFSDGKHCNDTKVYHQDYGIITDTGLKTKTMKKRALGYWDKVSGDMEAGIIELSVFEAFPSDFNSPQGDVCTVHFGNKAYTVKNVGIGNHSLAYYLQTVTWANVENSCTASNVDAIRYIDFAGKQAITFFPNQIVKKTDKKIELNFRVPFGGVSQGPGYINGEFHVIHQKLFGVTVRNNEIRGTDISYLY